VRACCTWSVRALIYVRKRILEWLEVPDVELTADTEAIVRPIAVARCDLDSAYLNRDLGVPLQLAHLTHVVDRQVCEDLGRRPFTGPFAYGHECVAEVLDVGSGVRSFARGDVVVVPFQISCGGCATCSTGRTAFCTTDRHTSISMYGLGNATGGWGGMMSDRLRVPFADHMLLPVPTGVHPAALASASDNLPDGWRAVAEPLRCWPSAPVLVLGGHAKSVGLYAVASAKALGAERVDYVDTDPTGWRSPNDSVLIRLSARHDGDRCASPSAGIPSSSTRVVNEAPSHTQFVPWRPAAFVPPWPSTSARVPAFRCGLSIRGRER
jgi:threonine dehydrogenase-like Zn-dependent dehydrogenase